MRSKLIISLCSIVVFCCVGMVAARGQEAGQSASQTNQSPSQTKKPRAARQTAKKSTATKKPVAQAPATTQDKATAQAPATAQDAATAQAAPSEKTPSVATKKDAAGVAAKRRAANKSAARKKPASDVSAPDASTENPSADANATTKAKAATKTATGDATKTQTPPANANAPKTDASSQEKAGAASKSAKPQEAKSQDAKSQNTKSQDAKSQTAKGQKKVADKQEAVFDPAKAAELKSKLEEILKLPAWERIAELQDFIELDLPDDLADRATEHLVSAEAAYGDERLQAGDATRGVALFRQAVALAPDEMSDKLFFEVVSQLPANLVLRGQPEAAFEIARKLEKISRGDAKRLLTVAAFYVTAEQPDDAARLAAAAVKLAPDLAAAHQALAAASRLSLRLDESVAEYARAAELDPKSLPTRRSLADLRRATGKAEDALVIYRELLAADATDRAARNGIVLSLFDAGRREEAERELEAALKDDPRNLQLLAGAAYWYAAHGDNKRALDLAGQVVQIEPRHPWAQVALARSLIATGMPFDAERSLRFVRLYSHFPTLDYELANALAAEGFYAEAADELARTFSIKDNQIETRLAGRTTARAESFSELLAPERRASIFEPEAIETPANARSLKGLLALHLALKSTETGERRATTAAAVETAAAAAARDFAAGDDPARAFRQLYAASRLLRRGVATRTALELVEASRKNVEDALSTSQATAAATADELRVVRVASIARGITPDIPDIPRAVLDRLMRGRIEELTGWALLNQGQTADAVAALRRAVGVLPENSLYWRNALWRLGNALAASGEPQEALNTYIKSFDRDDPDESRFAVIESLYRKLNGNLNGLDILLGADAPRRAISTAAPPQPAAPTVTTKTEATHEETKRDETKRDETKRDDAETTTMPAAGASATPTPAPAATPSPEAPTENKKAEDATDRRADDATPPRAVGDQGASKSARRVRAGECALALSSDALSLSGGASASVIATLEGEGDPSKITATTPNWSDIMILREPARDADAGAAKFTVTSISKTSGTYMVTIKSPCGAKQLTVTVK
jgi:Flp pilus assembly protein TadD